MVSGSQVGISLSIAKTHRAIGGWDKAPPATPPKGAAGMVLRCGSAGGGMGGSMGKGWAIGACGAEARAGGGVVEIDISYRLLVALGYGRGCIGNCCGQ